MEKELNKINAEPNLEVNNNNNNLNSPSKNKDMHVLGQGKVQGNKQNRAYRVADGSQYDNKECNENKNVFISKGNDSGQHLVHSNIGKNKETEMNLGGSLKKSKKKSIFIYKMNVFFKFGFFFIFH